MCVTVAQSRPTLCDSTDCNLLGSSLHGILQARILECIAFPFSRDLPNPGIKPMSPSLQVDSLSAEPQKKPKYVCLFYYCSVKSLSNCLFFSFYLKTSLAQILPLLSTLSSHQWQHYLCAFKLFGHICLSFQGYRVGVGKNVFPKSRCH